MKKPIESKESQFTQRIKSIYPLDFEPVLKTHSVDLPKSFRINNFKSQPKVVIESLRAQGFEIKKGKLPNSYICLNSSSTLRLSESQEAISMHIYIQELSSMIPALILNLRQGEKILDLCAAPGSKTTQMADALKNKGEIIAVEQNRDRWFKLMQILKAYGAESKALNENGKILPYKYKNYVQYFDKILIDAPCSNEASLDFRNANSFKYWRSSNSSNLSKLQKGLLSSAITMLKPGGTLIYSTCTYAVEENEKVIEWAIKRFPEMKVEEFITELPIANIHSGLVEYKDKKIDERLKGTVRIIPDGEFKGFYIAKLKKLA